jgi:hypothetical protein
VGFVTRYYAIMTKAAHDSLKDHFHPQYGSHYLDLPDSRLLVLAHFHNEAGETAMSAHPEVAILPDVALEGNEPLRPEHLAAVEHLQLEGNTVLHLARAAARIHPLMKLRGWM